MFFPVVVAVYYLLPARVKYIWLLIASYYFYMQWNPVYVFLLLTSTTVTYAGARILEKISATGQRKLCLFVAVFINLAILGYFKYANFFMIYFNKGLTLLGRTPVPWDNDILLPVGISFFTLQALGYLIDVYRGDIYAEHNFLKYALFISFFPQLVAGPIERTSNLLPQMTSEKKFDYEEASYGLKLMAWGFFKKLVLADGLAVFVDAAYREVQEPS